MKYTTEVEIHAPLEKVASLLGDHEQMKKWVKELDSFKLLDGRPRHEGAKTLLNVKGSHEMQVTETILKTEFPFRFTAKYEVDGVSFIADNLLQQSTTALTRYTLNHYFKFNGLLKVAMAFMKPAFVKRSKQMMNDFKKLAETNA
jgi:uncharacterized membrane protein